MARLRRSAILFATCLAGLLINLDMSIVNLALPTIGIVLHVKLSLLQWIVVAYLITASASFVVGGRLTDRYGARYISSCGMLFFLIGSVLCGFAPNGWIIAIGRAVQGIGFGLMVPAIISIACSQFAPQKKAYAIGFIIITAGITQCIGPTVGGMIIHWFSWRWIFLINIPLCILYALIILPLQRDAILEKSHPKLSYGGIFLYFLFSILLICASQLLEIRPIDWLPFFGALVFSVIFLIISHRMERKKEFSTIPYHLLRNKQYRNILVIRSVSQVSFFAYLFFIPFWYQGIFHLTPFESGLNLLYLSAGFGFVALFSGQITHRIGFRRNIWVASCLVFASSFVILMFADETSLIASNIGITLAGISAAFVVTPTVTFALESVSAEEMGQATGLFYSATVGVSTPLNVAIIGLIMSGCLTVNVMAALKTGHVQLNTTQLSLLPHAVGGALRLQLLKETFSLHDITFVIDGYRKGMKLAFSLIAVFCSLMAIVGLIFLYRLPAIKKQPPLGKHRAR